MRLLVDTFFPQATRIRLVLDNLNTHKPDALYETFPPHDARRLLRHLEFHYTPLHGSWLNMAELEFAALSTQVLDQRLSSISAVRHAAWVWEAARNAAQTTVHWRFTTADARLKLHRLYTRS